MQKSFTEGWLLLPIKNLHLFDKDLFEKYLVVMIILFFALSILANL